MNQVLANAPMIALPAHQFAALQTKVHALEHNVSSLEHSNTELQQTNAQLVQQLDWFKRQLFGAKSEKRPEVDAEQGALFKAPIPSDAPQPKVRVPAHDRQKHRTGQEVNDTGLRFGPEVPVREITLSCPELLGPHAAQYEIIDYKESLKLARQPGCHVVLKYRRPVIRHKAQGRLITSAAPLGVLDHAQVDVSFIAGMLVDKFVYHLPLYRLHQRLGAEQIKLARSTMGGWGGSGIGLIEPIAAAVMRQILSGAHLKIDETPIKAGRTKIAQGSRAGQGQMKTGWLWPMLGEHGDIAFGYSAQRGAMALKAFIGEAYQGTIQTDGYQVYAQYAKNLPGCTHALCWAHTRRAFLKAEAGEPQAIGEILELIRGLYAIERELKERVADAATILKSRGERSAPIVKSIFEWIDRQIANPALLPKSLLAKALGYAKERQAGLSVFLTDAWLALDTNDLERALRVIPLGRKNWNFCFTEFGAKQVAIIQTLLVTCRAHGIDPYTYLVDVLQRISITPNSQIDDLTPRIWATKFADKPMRSDLARLSQ